MATSSATPPTTPPTMAPTGALDEPFDDSGKTTTVAVGNVVMIADWEGGGASPLTGSYATKSNKNG
ncbi:hypothetical protein ACG7TL_004030 [Trametes sanguinea]